ncbi:MAG TPA: autotransporter-associated beta strand repeat-containing protein [Tepidisphaeraceae bacterium]|nr:autotransporter-associated beta strand repeat-containing protein [Tepidisphaeraceae bacterium]
MRRHLVLAIATAGIGLAATSAGANTEYDVTAGQTDLTAAGTYTTGGTAGTGAGGTPAATPPSTTNDVTFDAISYTPAAFTVNTSLSIGTLNNLDTTQATTISNTGTAADTLTLNGGTNSVPGTNASDLLYVAGGGTLTLTGGSGVTALGLAVASTGNFDIAGTATISSIISGSSGLNITGGGTLTLSGANTFTGGVTLNAGTLKLSGTSGGTALGAIANNITVASGATLDLNNVQMSNYTGTVTISGTGVSNNGAITNSGTTSINNNGVGNIALAGNASIGTSSGGRFDITGTITANGFTLTKIGSTYMADRSTSSTLANLVIAGGSWEVSTSAGMGNNATTTTDTIQPAGTLTFYNAPSTTPFLPTVDLNGGVLTTGSGSATLGGAIVLAANSTISGTLTFNSTSSVGGTGNLVVSGGDTFAGPVNFTGTLTDSANVAISGNIGSSVTNLIVSSATTTLSGVNTYSGTVAVNGGTLEFVNTGAMSGYPSPQTSHAITVASGATLTLGVGGTGQFTAADIANIGNGSLGISFAASGAYLGLDTTSAVGGTFTYSGVLSNAPATSLGYNKVGTGVLVLATTNTYSGATIVSNGVLRANDGAGLPANSLLNLAGGVLETSSNFARTGGTAAGNVEITSGTSGFSARGGNITVAFGSAASPAALTWGTAPFSPGTLDLNETTATGTVNFLDAINFGTAARTVQVNATAAGTAVTLSGLLSSGTGGGLTKTGAGTLLVTNASNTYSGTTTVSGGTLTFPGAGTLSTSSAISLGNGTINILNNGSGSSATISLGNAVSLVTGTTSTLNVGNNGTNTGNTVAFGALTNAGTSGATINLTASNGYLVSFPSASLPAGTGNNTTLNPTTTSVTISGNVTNAMSGFATGNYDTLYLSGTSAANSIGGIISDSATGSSTLGGFTRVIVGNTGAPTWTLGGASTYTGLTQVSAGTLILTGSLGNTPITVLSGATFAPRPASGTIAAGTAAANALGATLTLNTGSNFSMLDGAVGTFNLQQGSTFGAATTALTLGGANLAFNIGSSNADVLAISAGKAAVTGINTVSFTGVGSGLTLGGSYNFITANQGLTGTFQFPNGQQSETLNVGNANYVLNLSNSATAETVTVAASPALTWTGQDGGNGAADATWSGVNTNANFASGATPIAYTDGVPVVFQDTNPVTGSPVTVTTVSVGGVSPSSVTFNNSTAVTYTLVDAAGSTAGIAGPALVTKSGTGTVILSGTNTYTGGTVLIGGILQVNAPETAGTSGPLGASGTISFNGGTLQFSANNTFDYSSRFSNAANQAYSIDTNGQAVTFASALTSAGGTLTKLGAGTLTLSTGNNVDTYAGVTVVNGGTLELTGSGNASQGVLAGTPSITVNSGATLLLQSAANDVLGYTGGKETLIINDGTVSNNGVGTRATLANSVTMVGGTLGGTSTGDGANNGAYSFFNGAGVVATSDAAGAPATISANIGTQGAITFNITRGTSSSLLAGAPDLLVSGNIVSFGGTNGITKSGTGIMTIAGVGNNYSGATTVSAGELKITGALGTTAVTVASSATLAGGGSLGGALTASSGAFIAPSAPSTSTPVGHPLTITGALALSSGSTYTAVLQSPTTGVNPTGYDQLAFAGSAAISGATLVIDDSSYTNPTPGAQFWILDGAPSSTAITGAGFSNVTAGSTITGTSGTVYSVSTNVSGDPLTSGHDVVLSVVPEPASLGLLGLGALGLLARRRRRMA